MKAMAAMRSSGTSLIEPAADPGRVADGESTDFGGSVSAPTFDGRFGLEPTTASAPPASRSRSTFGPSPCTRPSTWSPFAKAMTSVAPTFGSFVSGIRTMDRTKSMGATTSPSQR